MRKTGYNGGNLPCQTRCAAAVSSIKVTVMRELEGKYETLLTAASDPVKSPCERLATVQWMASQLHISDPARKIVDWHSRFLKQ